MLRVSASPHIRDKSSTSRIMLDVVIALIPVVIASVFLFGWRSLIMYMLSVVFCVGFESLSRIVMKREQTIHDLSAVVTGLLLAAGLPAGFPIWMLAVGAFFAIVVVKQMFGGLGENFANPAVTGRIFLFVSFAAESTRYTVLSPFAVGPADSAARAADLVTSATPLALAGTDAVPSYLDLFLGRHAGCLGETCIVAILIGALYLVIRRVIDLWIPLTYIAVTVICVTLVGADPWLHLLSGALILAAFFMATDYVTSPTTTLGKLIFGVGLGLLTFLLRMYSSMPEGVSFSILLMNILTPHIERLTAHKTIGGLAHGKKQDKQAS